jgi:hypothetical protein
MIDGIFHPPAATNEPVLSYEPGTAERAALKSALSELSSGAIDLPMFVGGKPVSTGRVVEVRAPHAHRLLLGRAHVGGAAETRAAIEAARGAHAGWSRLPFRERAAVFLRAAELLAGPWRARLNAATMLGQSKTAHQAEIDAMAARVLDGIKQPGGYVLGETFSTVDAMMLSALMFADRLLPPDPAIDQYRQRIMARPAFQRAMAKDDTASGMQAPA